MVTLVTEGDGPDGLVGLGHAVKNSTDPNRTASRKNIFIFLIGSSPWLL
jgi:hypothetical protein